MVAEKNKLGVGVIVPVITPLASDGDIDQQGLERVISHCMAAGVHGILILGSAGEGICFRSRQRQRIINAAKRVTENHIPLYVGVFDASTSLVREKIKSAEGNGADAVVVTPHYYLRSRNQDEIVRHMEICAANATVPVLAYNNEGTVHVNIAAQTFKKIMAIENVIGLKESTQDWKQFESELALRGNTGFKVIAGGQSILGMAMLAGADGCMSGVANYAPNLVVELYDAARKQDAKKVLMLQSKVMRLDEATHAGDFFLAGIKYACSLLGLCHDYLSEPFERLTNPQKEVVRIALQQEGLIK
ncbi:MAG: hypothetical protein GWP14_00330 [Actinobacteria bacterium]|nr:hypothetical protein [Actinomycetota bacterium]